MSYYELDLHNLTTIEVVRKIQRTIINHPEIDVIIAIHGYHGGTEIKNLLMNKYNIHNKRVIKTEPDFFNEGRTNIYLRGSLYD